LVKRLAVVDIDKCVGCQSCMFACSRRFGDAGIGRSAIQVKSTGGIERGFTVVVCRACPPIPPCAKVCPTNALKPRKGGGVVLDSKKCIGCGLCKEACIIDAVQWDYEINKPIICVHCGICVNYCPYDVIQMEELEVHKEVKV